LSQNSNIVVKHEFEQLCRTLFISGKAVRLLNASAARIAPQLRKGGGRSIASNVSRMVRAEKLVVESAMQNSSRTFKERSDASFGMAIESLFKTGLWGAASGRVDISSLYKCRLSA
jgi:hypothetical protein